MRNQESLIYWLTKFYQKYKILLGIDFVNSMINCLENIDKVVVSKYKYWGDENYKLLVNDKYKLYGYLRETRDHIYNLKQTIPKTILCLKKKKDMHKYRRESFLYRIQIRQMDLEFFRCFRNDLRIQEEFETDYWIEKKIDHLIKIYRKNELRYREENNDLLHLQLLKKTSIPNDIIEFHIKPYFTKKRDF